MRQRILGAIGALLGATILVSRFMQGRLVEGPGTYARGQLVGLGLAALLLGIGLYYLVRGSAGSGGR